MSNRFTDTEKWDDPWFSDLSLKDKLFWVFLCDSCNHAGIWKVNWRKVKYQFGEDYEFNPEAFLNRIRVVSGEKWFIIKFILYQQKIDSLDKLNPNNKVHNSILNILRKEGVISPIEAPSKGLARGYSNSVGNSKGVGVGNEGVLGETEKSSLKEEIQILRSLEWSEQRIKDHLLKIRRIDEAFIDLIMGKLF